VLNRAPLELAGRVALRGKPLFGRDPSPRLVWRATTRTIYFDELPRLNRARRAFTEAMMRDGSAVHR